MDEADKLCDRVAIMDYGKIIALDTSSRLKETLEGDVVAVKAKNLEGLSKIVAEKLGFTKTHIMGDTLEITVRQGRIVLPRIIETATSNGISVESISLREPNLEDVFLHYTGRTIRVEAGKELHGFSAIQRRKIK
jgi:ABC-2 type transport system ATP-binding protein